MQTRYRVTVEEIGQEKRIVGGEWKIGAGEARDAYGYTPQVEQTCDYARTIYEQTVDDLDLSGLVQVVNGI